MSGDGSIRHRMRVFRLVWASQGLSLLGTRMANFTLGVWVFQETESVTRFTLIVAIGLFAGLVATPFLGVLVDRWDRRTAMLAADLVAGLRTMALIVLLAMGRLEVWHVYVAVVVRTVAEGIQIPAYQASVTLLVPRERRGRANGLIELAVNGTRVISPALAGLLMARAELASVLWVDFVSFLVAVVTLLFLRIPRPEPVAGSVRDGTAAEKPGLFHAAAFGWRYLRTRRPLLRLALYLAGFNTAIGLSLILVTPMVLSYSDVSRLGGVHSIIASGGVVGAILMSAWGGPKNRMAGVLAFTALAGLGLIAGGSHESLWVVAFGLIPLSFSIPFVNACSQTIWQNAVEPAYQGRVFATRTVLAQGTAPFAFLFAGVLADRLFEPLLLPGGALADSVGRLLGAGEGRGMGLMMVLAGLAVLAMAFGSATVHGMRHLEDELEDHEEGVGGSGGPGG
jgi:MFS family permease